MHIADFDSKIICLTGVISLYGEQKGPFQGKCNGNSIYIFSHKLFTFFFNVTYCEFSICYEIIP